MCIPFTALTTTPIIALQVASPSRWSEASTQGPSKLLCTRSRATRRWWKVTWLVVEIVSGHKGIERFNQYDDLAAEVTEMVREQSHSLFGESYSSQLESTLMDTEALGAMLDDDAVLLKAGDDNMPKDSLVCEEAREGPAIPVPTTG